ncbi:MAG: hypothetical protein ACT4N2_11040 [Hyphomicrobium sp.]
MSPTLGIGLALLFAMPFAATAVAQGDAPPPSAPHRPATATGVAGSSDARLETDAALREGMEAIRTAVRNAHTLITHRRFPPPMAAGFVATIKRNVSAIRQNTAAPDSSRRRLGALLDDIATGADLCRSSENSGRAIEGLFRITTALESYGETFDHPGWQRLQEQ